jgi:phosphate:Na+ symporter
MNKSKNFILIGITLVLGWGFWQSEDFMQLAAGVALFMFGMLALEQGFQAFTGGVLESVLGAATRTRARSLGFGLVATALMQSSSLVSLITISFLSAGLIGLASGIGIIFGSNIGTTTGAWLMASYGVKIDLASYAMPMAVFGILFIYQSDKNWKGLGHVLLGIAFLFIGIQFIKEGFEALSENMDLAQFAMEGFLGVLAFTGIGIVMTVIMQSSHAVLMLTIAALATGQVSYYNALALAIGTNVGTTITAVLGAMGSNVAGKRLAGAHMIFNVTVGTIAILFIAPLADLVDQSAEWLGIAADDYTLKLALFHTIFNVLGVLLMLPLIDRLVVFLEKKLPEKVEIDGVEQPLFLTESVTDYPDAALAALTSETQHLGVNALEILAETLGLRGRDLLGDEPIKDVIARSRSIPEGRVKELYRRRIKTIYSAILEFASKARPRMNPEQAKKLDALKQANVSLVEAIKELRLIRRNLARYSGSDNETIRAGYDLIRAHLAQFLRTVMQLREEPDPKVVRAALKQLRSEAKKDEALASGYVETAIREGLITGDMASSFINDSALAMSIHKHLIKAGKIVAALAREQAVVVDVTELPEEQTLSASERKEIDALLARAKEAMDARVRGYGGAD